MSKSFLLILNSIFLLNSSSSIVLDCSFNSNTAYAVLGKVYQCNVQNSLSVNSRDDLVIESGNGAHASLKTNDDVISFQAYNKGAQFFPRGLDKVFKNLRSIYIYLSKIQEVKQIDLKSLPNLIYFDIRESEIRYFEDGIFDFNPNLEVIWLTGNKIFHFDTNVFKNLNKISYLGLTSNVCMNTEVGGNLVEVKALIDSIKVKCFDSEFFEFKEGLKNLEIEEENLKLDNFKNWSEKLQNLEKYFKNSRFSNLNNFNSKFEDLKQKLPILLITFLSQHNSQINTCSTDDGKLSNLTQNFDNLDKNITKLSESFDNFKDQIEELKTIPTTVTKRLHKFEIMQQEFKVKMQSIERKMEEEFAKLDEKITKVIEALNK
ncbi:unnamed protein product [Chironomus riparius]|uniref:Uncharacterized protein n=1 Tax=Chironomus riparius TaxID=315576 RepID=A0A9P0JBM5_9DIPT|nr:unnamed protein product [Chironomus riparius]